MKMKRRIVWMVTTLALAVCIIPAGMAWAQGVKKLKPGLVPYTPKPDLVVDRVGFAKIRDVQIAIGKECQEFTVQPVISNRGQRDAGAFTVLLERKQGGAWIAPAADSTWNVSGLKAGASTSLPAKKLNNCNASSSFRITVDRDSTINESNENNNTKTAIYMPIHRVQGMPNLTVDHITFHTVQNTTNWQGKPCQIFNIQPVITNKGSADAGGFRVQLQWNKNGSWENIPFQSYWNVAGLAKGRSLTLSVRQYNNCDTSPLHFRIVIDSNHQVTESNENDNTKKATFPSIGHPPRAVFTPPQGWSPPR